MCFVLFCNFFSEVLQRRRGCSINSSFDQWAVNGEDFLTFDAETIHWTPKSDLAVPVAEEWDRQSARSYDYADFIQNVCVKSKNEFNVIRDNVKREKSADSKLQIKFNDYYYYYY